MKWEFRTEKYNNQKFKNSMDSRKEERVERLSKLT